MANPGWERGGTQCYKLKFWVNFKDVFLTTEFDGKSMMGKRGHPVLQIKILG
jgi:hypothetical protein